METIHIHDVLDIIYGTDKIYTISELKEEVETRFGDNVSLTSCSDGEFGISEMVNFMLNRGKIQLEGDKIIPSGKGGCEH